MAWDVVSRLEGNYRLAPHMSIQKDSSLGVRLAWNAALQKALAYPQHVNLLIDCEKNLLGIQPTDEESAEGFTVVSIAQSNSCLIRAGRALEAFGISREVTPYRKPAEFDGDVAYIPLPDDVELDTSIIEGGAGDGENAKASAA